MTASKDRASVSYAILSLVCTIHLTLLGGTARSQSDVVFLTNDTNGPTQSLLTRFDQGTETFGVTTGSSAHFQGVTILNNQVLVADHGLNAIQRFSPNGTLLGAFAAITDPTYLESDSSGNVYTNPGGVAGAAVTTRFNSSGVATETFSHVSMTRHAGVDADDDGNVYIADRAIGGSSLFKFASDGTFLNSISLGSIVPSDLSIDESSDLLYLADENDLGHGVKIFDISGAMPTSAGSMATPADAVIEGVHFAAESGNVLATDFGVFSFDPRGLEYSPAGVLLDEYRPTDPRLAFDITTYVPEPSSLVLIALGLLVLGHSARSRCRH